MNDYSAVREEQADYNPDDASGSMLFEYDHGERLTGTGLSARFLRAESVTGKCYVVTFSPSHNVTLADLPLSGILSVIDTWTQLYIAHLSPLSPLAKVKSPMTLHPKSRHSNNLTQPSRQYRYMQIFENKGTTMGCSNPHPHGQIWTTTGLPEEPALELEQLKKYRCEQGGLHLLEDYAQLESQKGERVVFENASFLGLCPWWATWPFETMVVAKRHKRALPDLNDLERLDFAEAISEITRRYDNLFETQFPYSMGLHQAPLEGADAEIEASYLHVHFYPPLLRSATVKKFLVGYELLAEPQRDITPEQAAAGLRDCGGEVYRSKLVAS